MITIKKAYEKFINNQKPEGFLSSAFIMASPEELENSNWQLDFYNKKTDTINSFLIKENLIEKINTEIKPFKEKEQEIKKINIENIKITAQQAYETAKKEIKEDISKIILLLQNSDKEIWNISFFTKSFNLINIKIDAKTKEIIEKTNAPLIQF